MAANPRTITDVQATILSAHANCTVEDKISFYDTWSKLYEQDMKILDYQAPLLASTCLADVMLEDRDQALVLDVACGTGLVAAQLQKLGFCNFHGLDGSEEMLHLAQSKSLYQSIQKCILGAESLPLSSGGFVCMTTRSNVSNQLYKTQLQALMEEMEQKRLWVKVKVQEIELWEKATSELESKGDSIYIPGTIYIYQKSRIPT
ncbi:methyltransferase-like protein 27 isoform X2 [Leucoraja erinacea]|uniref:methyltransferase-like protein 27 isoform X2 n=1 Tax=Leucoraja erinaceus TaxID=7782 RepID=UPI00245380C4|nr:methyltransferase-like protein 27 isoform X2 [Leucoraja erinacea]